MVSSISIEGWAAYQNTGTCITHICQDVDCVIGSLVVHTNMLYAYFPQHIEDLTQEKFSLQRALEASRTLAESLAAENSTLTDSYNQQVYCCS